MSNLTFEAQVSQLLSSPVLPCDREVIIEDTASMLVSRQGDLWFKVPEKEEYQEAKIGYLKAYALGYIDYLWIHQGEIITLHVEGIPLNKDHIPLLKELWNKMEQDQFYLLDWHPGNILYDPIEKVLKVIDWGYWSSDPLGTYIEDLLEEMIELL